MLACRCGALTAAFLPHCSCAAAPDGASCPRGFCCTQLDLCGEAAVDLSYCSIGCQQAFSNGMCLPALNYNVGSGGVAVGGGTVINTGAGPVVIPATGGSTIPYMPAGGGKGQVYQPAPLGGGKGQVYQPAPSMGKGKGWQQGGWMPTSGGVYTGPPKVTGSWGGGSGISSSMGPGSVVVGTPTVTPLPPGQSGSYTITPIPAPGAGTVVTPVAGIAPGTPGSITTTTAAGTTITTGVPGGAAGPASGAATVDVAAPGVNVGVSGAGAAAGAGGAGTAAGAGAVTVSTPGVGVSVGGSGTTSTVVTPTGTTIVAPMAGGVATQTVGGQVAASTVGQAGVATAGGSGGLVSTTTSSNGGMTSSSASAVSG